MQPFFRFIGCISDTCNRSFFKVYPMQPIEIRNVSDLLLYNSLKSFCIFSTDSKLSLLPIGMIVHDHIDFSREFLIIRISHKQVIHDFPS